MEFVLVYNDVVVGEAAASTEGVRNGSKKSPYQSDLRACPSISLGADRRHAQNVHSKLVV
jgi:hypothetical protein